MSSKADDEENESADECEDEEEEEGNSDEHLLVFTLIYFDQLRSVSVKNPVIELTWCEMS